MQIVTEASNKEVIKVITLLESNSQKSSFLFSTFIVWLRDYTSSMNMMLGVEPSIELLTLLNEFQNSFVDQIQADMDKFLKNIVNMDLTSIEESRIGILTTPTPYDFSKRLLDAYQFALNCKIPSLMPTILSKLVDKIINNLKTILNSISNISDDSYLIACINNSLDGLKSIDEINDKIPNLNESGYSEKIKKIWLFIQKESISKLINLSIESIVTFESSPFYLNFQDKLNFAIKKWSDYKKKLLSPLYRKVFSQFIKQFVSEFIHQFVLIEFTGDSYTIIQKDEMISSFKIVTSRTKSFSSIKKDYENSDYSVVFQGKCEFDSLQLFKNTLDDLDRKGIGVLSNDEKKLELCVSQKSLADTLNIFRSYDFRFQIIQGSLKLIKWSQEFNHPICISSAKALEGFNDLIIDGLEMVVYDYKKINDIYLDFSPKLCLEILKKRPDFDKDLENPLKEKFLKQINLDLNLEELNFSNTTISKNIKNIVISLQSNNNDLIFKFSHSKNKNIQKIQKELENKGFKLFLSGKSIIKSNKMLKDLIDYLNYNNILIKQYNLRSKEIIIELSNQQLINNFLIKKIF